MVSVAAPSECAQPFIAPPTSRWRLGAPPSFTNPVMPPTLELSTQLSQVMFAHPYPSPKPIQKPSRRCGYCARAADAAQENAASSATIRAVYMEPSLPGDGRGGGRVPCRKRQAHPRGGGVLARGQSTARSLSPPLRRCRPSRPRRSQRRCPPPETASPSGWGDAVVLHNLRNRDGGIRYAVGMDLQSDVRSVHLM